MALSEAERRERRARTKAERAERAAAKAAMYEQQQGIRCPDCGCELRTIWRTRRMVLPSGQGVVRRERPCWECGVNVITDEKEYMTTALRKARKPNRSLQRQKAIARLRDQIINELKVTAS